MSSGKSYIEKLMANGGMSAYNKQAEKTANPGKAYIENNISEFSNNKSNKTPLMSKSAEKPSIAQAIPFVDKQTAKSDNMFKQAEDVHNKAYADAGQAFSKYGNSEAFRASLVDNDANYKLGDADEESKKVYTNTVSSLYTESFLRELSENPTIENYNKFVNAYNTKPFAKAKIGDMDALDFANSIMYAGNSEFRNRKINTEIEKYNDEIKKNEKEIEAQEKLKAEYDEKGGNWFNDVVDTVVQIGTAGIARDVYDKVTDRINNRSINENRAKETQKVIDALEKEKSYNEKMRDAVEAALRTTYNVTSSKDFEEVLNSNQNRMVVSANSDVFDINGRGRTGKEIINNTEFDTKYGGANSDGLTKEQVDVFNYLLAKEGKDSAQKYLDDMEILTSDVAFQKQYAKIKDNKFFGGISQVNQGLTNVLSAPVRAVKSVVSDYNEYEIKPVGEKISDAYIQDAGTLGRISYGLLRSGTELAPSMLLGGMGFAKAGKLLFSTNVYANSFKEAKEKGYGKGKAIIYGLSNAVIENALESMGGQKIGDDIFKVASSKVDDALRNSTKLKFIGYQFETLAKTMGEEAFEEYAAETIAPILKNALFGEKNKFTLMSKEQIEASISGALLGGLLSTAGAIPRVSNVLKNDYNFDKSVYLSMDDSKAIDLYMDRITDNMITYSLSKKIDGFDTKTQEEKDALILKERQNMRKRISASEAKEALSEEYRLSAVVSLYEEAAKDGISMEETAKLAKKKGIDAKGFEDFAKEAYKIGQAEALTKDIDTDILRRSAISKVTNENPEIVNAITPILSKSTSEILDTLGEQFPAISREDAFKLVTSIKNKQFSNRLSSHLTNEEKAQEIVKYIESENKKEDLYNANKSYDNLVDVLNREGDNKLVVATDAISNSIVNAIKSKINAEAPIENINKTVNDALTEKSFNKLSFIASLANTYTEALKGKNANVYLAVANSGIDVPSALVYYNTSGVIPSGVNANAFAILGNSFNSIAEPALTQTEVARKAIPTEAVSDVSESENGVVEVENNVQNEIESIADYIKAAFKEFANARISKKSIKDVVAEALLKDKSNAEIIKGLAELYTNSLELKKSKDLDILKRGKTDTNAAVETLTEYVLSNTVTDGNDAKKVMKAASAFKQVAGSALSYIESAKAKTMKTNVDKSEVKTSGKVTKTVEEAIPKVIPEATEDIKTTEKSIKPAEEITEITTDVPNKNDNSKVFNSEADKMETEEKTSEIISEQNEADDITKEAVKKTNEENISVSEETSVLENKAVETEKADENKSSDNNDALELTDKCELIATKHTQTGDDIYVITVKDRLSKEQYNELNQKVKAVGGYYSRFAKTPDGKAIPGFVFKSEPSNDVVKVFNDFFGESTSAEDDNTQVENKSDVKESNIKEIDTNALFGALKNAKDGDEVKLSDYKKQKTNDEVLNKQSESDIIEEKTDVEADTNDREQSGILAAESEGHITGNETEEVQDDEEGRDIGGSDGDSGTVGTDEVSDDTRVADGEQDTAEGVRDAEPDTGHDFNSESGEHTDSERGSDTGSDVSSRKLNTHNYRITEDIDSARPSISDNLEAIRVLKELEKSGKKPTKAQQAILAKYKGWGGLKSAFTDYYNTRQLREIMTDEEFKAARAGVLDAFYTSTKLISGIYKGLSRLGFKGGNILEPSMGTGNFFGVMPAGISSKSNLYGVELDPITGRIAKYLYPDANIEISGFQDVKYPEGTFDAVVGNVPFVDVSIPYKGSKYMLHDYFFIKSLDTLKEGGVLAVLTSTGTLDKLNTKARHEMAKRANLIAAYRLPNDAFATNAGTSVTTDLIILQKRGDTIPFNGEPFERLGKIGNIQINEYFANHPENVLGELSFGTDMYGKEKSFVDPFEGKDFAKVFDKAISRLPKDLLTGNANQAPVDIQVLNASKSHFEEKNGDIIFFDSDTGTVDVLSGKAKERAKSYIAVKDAYNNLLEASKAGVSKLERDALRSILNKAYDDFHTKHGNLQDKANKSLEGDSEFVKVTGIELYNPDKKAYEKSGIFTTDTIGYAKPVKADSSLDALAISINESGTVDLKRISSLTGKSIEETVSDLEGSIIETPDGGYELIPVYASGNIREKLKAVEGKEGFERNVELLKSVMPKDKAPSEIVPQLGASWIPAKYISDFIKDVFGSYYTVQVNYDPTSGTWNVEKFWSNSHTMNQKYGTSRMNAYDLFVETLNLKSAKIYDTVDSKKYFNKKETSLARQKQAEIKEAFSNWIFKDADRRNELVKVYNELFNSHRNMDYAELSKYLTFPGLKSSWKMRDYQKAAVARVVFGGNTLLAHGVGTGKTCEMIASAMEMKRMGITKKNVFVVPKHKIGDFRNDILKMYPEAKVLMATEKDFEKKNRGKLFSKIGTNDWDIVIIGHSSFGLLPVSSQTEAAYIEKQKNELEDVITRAKNESGGRIDKRFVSGLEKSLKSLEARLKEALDTKKDDTITFEELGIDGLFVDEAHNFKNLPFYTKLNLPGVKGGTSKRASDMFMKTEYLRDRGGRIVFATATPITNSVSEFYNMTRFVRPDALKDAGIYSFDSWASTFGSIETKMEMSPDGKNYRTKERFSKYNNVREMVGLFRQFADILRTGDVVKDLPKANYIDVISPSLDFHDQYINNIIERMKRVSSGGQSREDNMLLITNDGRAMATDLRLVASQIENFDVDSLDVPTSRINKAVSNIITEYKKSDKIKGTQFVFLDFGMNANDEGRYNYNLYGDLISKLVEGGIPESEIAKIGDYDTVAKKDVLFKKVNDGEVRVLIGSTAKMGEGMNAQERAVALHHLNAPYRPSDIEQREGRIIRHGNINKDVNIYRYIQEKSFDSYMWQMLARKGEFINQALSDGDISELEETDEFVLSAKQGMAVATGNPLILKKVEIDEEVKRLQGLKKSYDASIYDMQDRLAKLPGEIEATKLALSRTKEDIKTLEENNSEDFLIKLAGKVYDKRADAAKALVPLIKNKYGATGSEVIGSYRGLNLTLTKTYSGGILYIGNKSSMKVELSDSAEGNITRITNAASRFDSYAEFLSKRVTTLESELKSIKNDIDLPFKYQSQLDKAIAEQADIDSQLNFGEDSSDVFEDMNDKFKSQEELDEEEREAEEEENDSDEKTKYFLERRKESEQQTERKSLLHGRTGQTDLQSSGKQDESLYGDAGAKAGRTFEERRNYAKEIVSQKGYFDIVAEDGHVKFIDEKFLNDEMRNIESLCYKFGRNVRFMLGGMYIKDYGTAYGVKTKNNEILVSYTAAESPWQICRHEIIHTEFNNERFQKYKKVVTDYLTGDVLEKALLLPRYQNYSEFMKTTQDVIEEMICDIFAGSAPEELALFDDTVEAYWKDTLGTNGSPVWLNELMSDDLFKNNKPFLSTEDGADFEESEYEFSDEWEDKVEEFGAIPQGENPVRDISVPKKISKTQYVSRFARTMMEAGVTPDDAMSEFEKLILDGTMVHEVITNDAARKKAEEDIRYDGFEDALTKWIGAVDTGNFSKYLIVKGQVLYNQCITNKDVANAMRVAAELTAMATQAGQTLQACRVLKLMSPDGQLYYLEKSVKKMNDELRQQIGDKYENIILDDDLMEAFLNATSEDAKNAAYDDLCQDIADQIPSTFRDKWDSWRYLAMLGNPRTHVRNVLGNGSFWLATRVKEFVAVGVEKAFKVPKEERMRSVYRSKEALAFAKKDAEKVKEQLMGNSKFSFGGFVRDKRTIYDTKWLENLRQKNFKALEWEDWLFLESHYMDALSRIITIRNVDVNNLNEAELENLRTYAIKKAQENTFREMTAAAKAINTVKHRAAHSRSWFIRNIVSPLIEGTIAFTTVPINVVKQGVLYTPAGIASGIMKNIAMIKQNGDVSVQDAIDDIAKGLTGTGFLLLGMLLRSLNLISGGDEEDEKKKAFDKMVGEQSYSITILGHSFDINWANPINIPLFVGAELTDLLKGEGFTLAQCIEVLSGMTDPVFELSFLSGVTRLLSSFGKDDSEKVSEVVIEMLTSYIMQGVPTLGGALSRIIDSQKRDYYYVDKNNEYLPAAVQRLIGEASSKIPLMSYLFAPSVDNWGRDESYGGTIERVLENTVSPGYYSKENYTEVDEELLRLYNQTGDNAVFPPSISKYFKEDGERFDFTAGEYASYKRDRGQRGFKYVYELINSSSYARMSDNEKVKAIEKCYDRAREEAKLKYLGQPIPEVIDAFGRGDDYKSYSEKQAVKNGYFSPEDYDNVEINLTQLMEDNNIDNLYPTVQSDYYTSGGIKYNMTEEQHAEACKIRGKKSMELLVAFFNDENLRHGIKRYSRCKNDAEIIEAIKDIYSYAGEYTKDIMFDKVKSNKK